MVKVQRHAQPLQLVQAPFNDAGEFPGRRRTGPQRQLSTGFVGRIENLHRMATLSADARAFQPGRSRADDAHIFWGLGW